MCDNDEIMLPKAVLTPAMCNCLREPLGGIIVEEG